MIAITIQGVTKRFGSTLALDRLDLRIEPGEVYFLLGPSGCGKTTLLRSIAGFYEPDEGRILFDNEDVSRVPPHRRNTGMMFQNYALWPHMTVAQNVAFGLEERKTPKAETKQRVATALASVKMEDYAERKIAQLSGGQQQRVALARALVIRPRCLLLDEPLSNLDAKLRLEMRAEIRRVCKESRLTAIYVTHDQKEALSIADRIAILDRGRLQQTGTPREVYRRPATRFVADFIGETNFLDGTVVTAANSQARVSTRIGEFSGMISRSGMALKTGDRVTLAIRPESWMLKKEPASENGIRGTIESTTYLGEVAQYQFRSGDEALKVFEINPRFVESARDAELYAAVTTEDVIVLKD